MAKKDKKDFIHYPNDATIGIPLDQDEKGQGDPTQVNVHQIEISPSTRRFQLNLAPQNVAEQDNLFEEELAIFGKPSSNTVPVHKSPSRVYDDNKRYSSEQKEKNGRDSGDGKGVADC